MRTREDLAKDAAQHVGTTFAGKWHIDALLGIGASAAVFAATHRNKSRVAIKLMHRHLAADARRKEAFLREAYVANSVEHPAVVRIFDDGIEGGQPFFVAELLSGVTLADAQREAGGRLPWTDVVRAMETLLDVLAVAHGAGVLHRDIKPSNLFREAKGAVRVLDFGLASLAPEDADHADLSEGGPSEGGDEEQGPVGTPGYMAPEQASARTDLIDARSDLWSVGATALFLLTGRFVHDAQTTQELMARIATQPARAARDLDRELPATVAAWLDRALKFSRVERFQSAEEMRSALSAIERGLAETSTKVTVARAASEGPTAQPRPSSWALWLPVLLVAPVAWFLATRAPAPAPASSVDAGPPAPASVSAVPVVSSVPPAPPPAASQDAAPSKVIVRSPLRVAPSAVAPLPSASAVDPLDRRM